MTLLSRRRLKTMIAGLPRGDDILAVIRADRHPGRSLPVRDSDRFLVAYSKSGSTWLRYIVANLVHGGGEGVTFANLATVLPSLYDTRRRTLQALPSPRLIKSHEYLDPRYRRVAYLVRDPRAVFVSFHHYQIMRGLLEPGAPQSATLASFLDGTIDGHGTWREHVLGWLATREGRPGFVWHRYEDLLEDPRPACREICDLFDIEADDEAIERALAASTADAMRSSEKKDGQALGAIRGGRPGSSFVRKASSDAWREEIDPACEARIRESFGDAMERLGYL